MNDDNNTPPGKQTTVTTTLTPDQIEDAVAALFWRRVKAWGMAIFTALISGGAVVGLPYVSDMANGPRIVSQLIVTLDKDGIIIHDQSERLDKAEVKLDDLTKALDRLTDEVRQLRDEVGRNPSAESPPVDSQP